MTMQRSIASALQGLAVSASDGSVTVQFQFPPDDPTFAGHFPGKPMVPGVFQLEMARYAAQSTFGRHLVLREVEKAKFLRPLLPEQRILLALHCRENGDFVDVRAEFRVNEARAGEMLLRFSNP